jgi:(2R)-3-sulfolactate dehydrogenase (NADP+)
MAPVGEAKGAALAFMVEVLAAALTGSHLAFEASSFLDAKGPPPGTGQFLIAIDPGAFGHNHFAASVARLAAAIEDQEGARLPGVRRHEKRATARSQGIVIPSAVINAYGKPSSG